MDRTLRADGLTNARDLGGLPRRDGSATPSGVFFRAENVDRLTPAGWDQVYAAGVRSVVDLRQPAERARDTSPRPAWLTTRHVDHDGLDEHPEFWVDYWETGLVGTALYYLPHLAALPERTGAVLAALADAPEGGVLFHCMAGRDRTGLIAAILLSAVDTEPEAIVDDYLETVRRGARPRRRREPHRRRGRAGGLLRDVRHQHGGRVPRRPGRARRRRAARRAAVSRRRAGAGSDLARHASG